MGILSLSLSEFVIVTSWKTCSPSVKHTRSHKALGENLQVVCFFFALLPLLHHAFCKRTAVKANKKTWTATQDNQSTPTCKSEKESESVCVGSCNWFCGEFRLLSKDAFFQCKWDDNRGSMSVILLFHSLTNIISVCRDIHFETEMLYLTIIWIKQNIYMQHSKRI